MRYNRVAVLVALLLILAATAASAAPYNYKPNSLRFRYGDFELDGDSVYWRTREADFFGSTSDFDDDRLGVTFTHMRSERWGVMFTASAHEGQQTTSFIDFVDFDGSDIFHTTTLETSDIGVGIVYYILRRDAIVAPYVGAGGGFYFYDLREEGDFIDFDTFDIFSGSFTGSGDTFGLWAIVGLEIPITTSFSIFGEARWHDATADLEDDFRDFGEIDLGGRELTVGASFRF